MKTSIIDYIQGNSIFPAVNLLDKYTTRTAYVRPLKRSLSFIGSYIPSQIEK